MNRRSNRITHSQVLPGLVLLAGLAACGGGGGSSASTTPPAPPPPPAAPTVGFTVPSEISAVAPKAGSALIITAPGNHDGSASAYTAVTTLPLATDPGTDYTNAKGTKFVAEHAVSQFSIIQTILNAMAQTHYADKENLNAGPYKAIVSWEEEDKGNESKSTQTWVVDSAMIKEGDKDVNRVRTWIDDGGRIIKAEFKIYASATKRSDGTYQDYGVWTLNAKLDPAGTSFFAAKASIGPAGETLVSMNQSESRDGSVETMRAFMSRSDQNGYGKINYPENNGPARIQKTVAYAYNPAQLRIKDEIKDVYKDRAATVEITHRYGMFDAATGADVMKSHAFGFPVSYTSGGTAGYGYYGAWQGRHQLWAGQNGGILPDGTTVTRQDRGTNAETYQTASFTGVLTKRTLAAADVNDLLNIPVETWVNFHRELVYDGSQWTDQGAPFTDFASLVQQPRKFVGLHRWDQAAQRPRDYVYVAGSGFFLATSDPATGQMVSTGTPYVPAASDRLWVDIGGSVFIQYTGANGWVAKKVLSFNEQTWTPVFDPAGDQPFPLELNFQYYINKQGGNYLVTRTGTAVYDVKIELQTPANPVNAATLLGSVATFRPQGANPQNPGATSTYRFDTTPGSPTFLKLLYLTVGTQDANQNPAPQAGAVVAGGQWGLMGYDGAGQSTGIQFNWDYPRQGETFAIQTFLYTQDTGGTRTYKLLDNPIALAPLTLSVNGQSKTYSLQFDGWMHGLPEYFDELSRNDWTLTDEVASKVVNIPEGTTVTDALNSAKTYLVKPLESGLYLKLAATPDPSLSLTAAQAVNLSDPALIPAFTDPNLGSVPTGVTLKYSEGKAVQ